MLVFRGVIPQKIGPEISGLKTEKFPHPLGWSMLESSPAPALGWRFVPPVVSQLTEICPGFFPRILRPSIWFHLGEWFAKTNRPLKRAWAAMAFGGWCLPLALDFSAELFPWQFCVLPKKQRTKKSRTHRHSDDNGWSKKVEIFVFHTSWNDDLHLLSSIFIYFQVS